MNQKEHQKKFDETNRMKNSEFAQFNNSATTNPSNEGRGTHMLPVDLDNKITMKKPVRSLLYAVLSIALFFIQDYFGRKYLPTDIYASTKFLVIVLVVSLVVPMLLYLIFLIIKRFKK